MPGARSIANSRRWLPGRPSLLAGNGKRGRRQQVLKRVGRQWDRERTHCTVPRRDSARTLHARRPTLWQHAAMRDMPYKILTDAAKAGATTVLLFAPADAGTCALDLGYGRRC
jgi:hypothetical protein